MFEIVIEEFLWSIRGSYQTIWSSPLTNVKWHSVIWPHIMTALQRSDFIAISDLLPNSIFYRIMRGFHRTFATGVACRQETLTPPETWSRQIWDLHIFFLLRPILFPNVSLSFRTMHFKHPSVFSRFCYVWFRITDEGLCTRNAHMVHIVN